MILLEDGPGGRPALFDAPRGLIRADRPGEVAPALAALDAARAAGNWVAGFLAYEAGYALEPRLARLAPPAGAVPLLAFGLYPGPAPAEAALARAAVLAPSSGLAPPRPRWGPAEHAAATRRVLDWIAAGDIYQANLTFPLDTAWTGSPAGLWAALRRRQPVGHGALVQLPGLPAIVSRSPELFFSTDAAGRIEARPMKGTAPRHRDPARDARLRDDLAHSVKDRAENLMIVDLLRNDISRIARPGSVAVPALFAVETYATVHQMVSRITAQLPPGTGLAALMAALFPCGSVTGAPKIRAMEVIRALEPWPRGVYCGAIGWMGPDGASSFNVAIRTLTLFADGRAEMNVGGGIVHDSTPAGEYQEALWKARFARPEPG
ncbi:MAG: aminodeoxychorismate synthase component I [Rhodobacteraceae bacterium]|nr:aminodeoxychorismate synthase component I [Paracoccaceae bacterium]